MIVTIPFAMLILVCPTEVVFLVAVAGLLVVVSIFESDNQLPGNETLRFAPEIVT